jgi:hypothetical protein
VRIDAGALPMLEGEVFSVRMGAFDDGPERFGGSAWSSAAPGSM